MRRSRPGLLAISLACAVAFGCDARPNPTTEAQNDHPSALQPSSSAPSVGPAVDTVVTRQEPEAAFRAARAVFATNRAEAATQLRHASRFIKNEASLASGRAHDDLQASARAVDRMIEDLEGARALTVDVLDAAAAHAHAALASAHLARARRDRAGQQNHAAGEQVIAAASHLALASGYSGRRESAVDSAAAVARELGAKLVRGAGWTEQEVSTALEGLEAHIEQVARRAPGGAL